MARREHREVKSRLRLLLAHRLKWEYQPDMRTGSWAVTLMVQRSELRDDFSDSRVLYNRAVEVLESAYHQAVRLASAETGLPPETFPETCPVTLDELLAE